MIIDSRSVLELGLIGAAASSFPLAGAKMAAAQSSGKTYVLVHGAWHGGWCWREVPEGYVERGTVSAPRHKLGSGSASTCCRKTSRSIHSQRISSITLRRKSSMMLFSSDTALGVRASRAQQINSQPHPAPRLSRQPYPGEWSKPIQ